MKQRILSKELCIIVDVHEKEVGKILEKMGAKVIRKKLDIGDFICPGNVAIERKAHSDFVQSIIDGRLFRQVEELSRNFNKVILIIEGFSNRKISENSLKAAISAILLKNSVSLVNTKNEGETANLVYWIAKKSYEKKKEISFALKRKKVDYKLVQLKILSEFPGISYKKAKRLLKRFGNLKKIFNASELDLQKVEGIGLKLARNIKRILEEKVMD